eukprot:13470463-Alexandrium_andersonii.AAC.1
MTFRQLAERLPDSTYLDLTTQPEPLEVDWEEGPGLAERASSSTASGILLVPEPPPPATATVDER